MARARLVEDRVAVGQGNCRRALETSCPGECAEIVVETPVFLHQDHDVLDVVQARAPGVSERPGRRSTNARGQDRTGHRGASQGKRAFEELAPADDGTA